MCTVCIETIIKFAFIEYSELPGNQTIVYCVKFDSP